MNDPIDECFNNSELVASTFMNSTNLNANKNIESKDQFPKSPIQRPLVVSQRISTLLNSTNLSEHNVSNINNC